MEENPSSLAAETKATKKKKLETWSTFPRLFLESKWKICFEMKIHLVHLSHACWWIQHRP